MIGDDLGDGRPVLECPLGIQRSLAPGDYRGLLTGGDIEVLKGIGNVLGVTLGVAQECIGDVEVDGVCEAFLGEEFADVGHELGRSSATSTGRQKDGLFLAQAKPKGM